jgi:hypothetical protein
MVRSSGSPGPAPTIESFGWSSHVDYLGMIMEHLNEKSPSTIRKWADPL